MIPKGTRLCLPEMTAGGKHRGEWCTVVRDLSESPALCIPLDPGEHYLEVRFDGPLGEPLVRRIVTGNVIRRSKEVR